MVPQSSVVLGLQVQSSLSSGSTVHGPNTPSSVQVRMPRPQLPCASLNSQRSVSSSVHSHSSDASVPQLESSELSLPPDPSPSPAESLVPPSEVVESLSESPSPLDPPEPSLRKFTSPSEQAYTQSGTTSAGEMRRPFKKRRFIRPFLQAHHPWSTERARSGRLLTQLKKQRLFCRLARRRSGVLKRACPRRVGEKKEGSRGSPLFVSAGFENSRCRSAAVVHLVLNWSDRHALHGDFVHLQSDVRVDHLVVHHAAHLEEVAICIECFECSVE